MTFGELIKNSRNFANMPLRVAAKQIGISIGYLNDLENERALRPKMKYLYSMAGLYGIPIDEICLKAERIPQDVFYKILQYPELLEVVRSYKKGE